MVNRRTLMCRSCSSKIVTRTQIGSRDIQTHEFACPKCGISIEYVIDLDQNIGLSYRTPKNADWVADDDGVIAVLTFSDAIPVPRSPGPLSPFIATFSNFENWGEYRGSEERRQRFVRVDYPYIDRCMTHFERGDWELFDNASPRHPDTEISPRLRLISLYRSIRAGLSHFTFTPKTASSRVRQRLIFARARRPDLLDELASLYVQSGRMLRIWRELREIRGRFVAEYNEGFNIIVQSRYWRKTQPDLARYEVTVKRFDQYRQLYIDAFETLCRLLVISLMVEAIIHTGCLMVPLSKRSASLDEFEKMANGTKRSHFLRMSVGDLFQDVLELDIRNGIGHHSAHYDLSLDAILIYGTGAAASVTQTIEYTCFCEKVVRLFSAVELAATYYHVLHIQADGRLQ